MIHLSNAIIMAFPEGALAEDLQPLIDSMEKRGYVLFDHFEMNGSWKELYFYSGQKRS